MAGAFTDIGAGFAGVAHGSVAWGDYDNDGDLDILSAGSSASSLDTRVYRNDGGTFTDIGAGFAGLGASSAAWGDYDNDGDLDVLVAGDSLGVSVTKLYRNNATATNSAPAAPTGLVASAPLGEVTLSWTAATDAQTPAAGLTYNLRVGTTPGGSEVSSPMAADSGYRRLPAMGNLQLGTTAALGSLPPGTYYWSVQAIDSAFAGSVFAPERSVSTGITIQSFTANPVLVAPGGCSTLSWSVVGGGTVTLDGASVGAVGSTNVCPSLTTTYVLVASGSGATVSRSVTVQVNDGTAGLGAPTVTSPTSGQTVVVTGVGFSWTGVGGATGYDLRVFDGATGAVLFSGSLVGGGSTSTLISLSSGSYRFAVRGCSGGFSTLQCGGYGTVLFTVSPAGPSGTPVVTFPGQGANLTTSTQTLSWTAVTPNPALSGLAYEVLLRDVEAGSTVLQISVPAPATSTIFTMGSSTHYELKVRACQASCGPWSVPVSFSVTLPAVPAGPPAITGCAVSGGNSLTCSWSAVANADVYQVQVVQPPPAGPGGGALTVAAKQVSATTVTLPVPAGAATVFVAACNGDGCGPYGTHAITAAGPNPTQANLGTPMAGTVVSGPSLLLTWNRVAGDNGTNTWYRLYVQDLSRQSAALDVYTQGNFYGASFKAEGARYDALVISNPGLASQATGPAQGFNVSGSSATAPTMVSPAHNGTVGTGNIQLGWSPVPGSTLYEYYVAVLGQGSATVRGVTPGLLAEVPLTGSGGGTVYSGIVRACPAGAACAPGSDAGWGPWSNAPGGPGVTNFTVTP